MQRILSMTVLVFALAACSKPVAAPAEASSAAASSAVPASFKVEALTDADNDIQGCQVMLDQKGVGQVFIEDGVDTGAHGYIRVDGARYRVDLTTSVIDEKGGVRVFVDKKSGLTVTEALTTGAAHEESDSVEQSGSIVVAFKGVTQKIAVDGGTAC
ncbi:hypothetical protein [Asticcacaulis solisilvae]|uniref:hypothetical protein n=1 Tax=Asticcacaulis solisilvae TaxID=1217274 RepID=UPI003FD8071C